MKLTRIIALALVIMGFCFSESAAQTKPQIDLMPVKTKKKDAQFDIGAIYYNIFQRDIVGFHIELKWFIIQDIATGFYVNYSTNDINYAYGYQVAEPRLDVISVGWINQYDIINDENLKFGVTLDNGYLGASLKDPSQKEKHRTKYGYSYSAKSIATNGYYAFEPGMEVSYRVISKVWLTAKYKYKLLLGSTEFGSKSDLYGSSFALCISFIFDADGKPSEKKK